MKIAVVGAGAIGGLLGAKLSLAGEHVTFIARNRILPAIQGGGFRLIQHDGTNCTHRDVAPSSRPADAGPQDVVLLTVKAHQVRDLLPRDAIPVRPETIVVTMINGLPWWYFHKLGGPHEGRRLESRRPRRRDRRADRAGRIVGSVVYPAAELVAPGRRPRHRGQPLHRSANSTAAQRARRRAVAGADARPVSRRRCARTSAARSGSSCGAT